MEKEKFTIEQIAEYITSWMIAPPGEPVWDVYISALRNSKVMLEDEQDGIAAYFERMKQ